MSGPGGGGWAGLRLEAPSVRALLVSSPRAGRVRSSTSQAETRVMLHAMRQAGRRAGADGREGGVGAVGAAPLPGASDPPPRGSRALWAAILCEEIVMPSNSPGRAGDPTSLRGRAWALLYDELMGAPPVFVG